MSKTRKTYLIDEGLIEKIKKIKEENNYNSETAVIIEAVGSLYRKLFPGYVEQRKLSAVKSPEERADALIKINDIRKQREEEILLDIAERLGAEIVRNDGGGKVVKYYTYDKSNRYLQEVPLTMMTPELIDSQYYPSREEVERRQAEGKVNY